MASKDDVFEAAMIWHDARMKVLSMGVQEQEFKSELSKLADSESNLSQAVSKAKDKGDEK